MIPLNRGAKIEKNIKLCQTILFAKFDLISFRKPLQLCDVFFVILQSCLLILMFNGLRIKIGHNVKKQKIEVPTKNPSFFFRGQNKNIYEKTIINLGRIFFK